MKVIHEPAEKTPKDWELIIFACDRCGTLSRIDTPEEAQSALEMWGMGAFAYFVVCPTCSNKLAQEVPLLKKEESLYTYIRNLEQKEDQ